MKRTQRGWRPLSPVPWAAVLAVCACGDPPAGPDEGGTLVLEPGHWLLVLGESESVDLAAVARDAQGRPIPEIQLDWRSLNPNVVTADPTGRVSAVSPGTATVVATWRGLSAEAVVEVWDRPAPDPDAVDASQFGREHYIEYVPGALPLILSAPHGGGLRPDEIPDRTWGVTAADRETVDQVLRVRDAFVEAFGSAPHLVISHLSRAKLDPNREVDEAAQGSPFAAFAWSEYHEFVEAARESVVARHGWGLYLDLHGHGHDIQRVELGYLLTAEELGLPEAALDGLASVSSVRELVARSGTPLTELVRGPNSLGTWLATLGTPSVPSAPHPWPGSDPYFRGGYSTARHGSRDGGSVSGIQLELYWEGLRDGAPTRQAFAVSLAQAVDEFLMAHLGPGWEVP